MKIFQANLQSIYETEMDAHFFMEISIIIISLLKVNSKRCEYLNDELSFEIGQKRR